MPSHVLLGLCLFLLGSEQAINQHADLPFYANGVDCSLGCTTSMVGGPVEYAPGQCYLPLYMDQTQFDFLWCQDVIVTGDNGPVTVQTPCDTDPNVVTAASAPYAIRAYWADVACPDWAIEWGWCTLENVCTAADKLAGDCTCTPEDEPCAPADAGAGDAGEGDAGSDAGELDGGTP